MDFSDAGEVFDLYVDWPRRLAREIPFLEETLNASPGRSVVDVACGTGRHTLALAGAGFQVTGVDPDERLLTVARETSHRQGLTEVAWINAAFATLPTALAQRFDSVICLGNSISLIPPGELDVVLANLAGLLVDSGVAIVHTINYSTLAARPEQPWGPVRVLENGDLLLKGFVPQTGGPWDALLVALDRSDSGTGKWRRRVFRFQLYPHVRDAVERAGRRAGMVLEACYGGFRQEPAEAATSADLVYVFRNGALPEPI